LTATGRWREKTDLSDQTVTLNPMIDMTNVRNSTPAAQSRESPMASSRKAMAGAITYEPKHPAGGAEAKHGIAAGSACPGLLSLPARATSSPGERPATTASLF